MENIIKRLAGRLISRQRYYDLNISISNRYIKIPAISVNRNKMKNCNRCKSIIAENWQLPNQEYYCRNCIYLGRLTSNDELLLFDNRLDKLSENNYLTWDGQLSPQQAAASKKLQQAIDNYQNQIIWAVTGAGKTEILFNSLNKALIAGKRIVIASPRIDVCLELHPRISAAFSGIEVGLLHGKIEDDFLDYQLLICTVHQLLKFRDCFDVVVIDEVDSYPLNGNKVLMQSIDLVRTIKSSLIFLTATPQASILERNYEINYLPIRFHKRFLPVPKLIYFDKSNKCLFDLIQENIKNSKRFLIYFPDIKIIHDYYQKISREFTKLKFTTVDAKDSQRIEKVQKFRSGEYFALLTTTILERGVTFKNINVVVYEADHKNFSETALIQIAGRADRATEEFNDKVYFLYREYNQQLVESINQIKKMNKLGEQYV